MEGKTVLALPEGLELIGLEQMDGLLVVTAASTQCAPRCPLCGVPARWVHSRYTRCVADLPCGGQPIRLLLQVRKCFCEQGDCPRKIFVERLARLATNQERFDSMIELQKLGIPQDEVARRLGVTKRTVQNWNKHGSCPGSRRRHKQRSLFDPYAAYVLKRWKDGCKTGSILYQEIKAQGYRGSDQQVYRFLRTLKQEKVELPELPILSRLSVRESLWLLARPLDDLEADERADLEALCQLSTELTALHLLVQAFGQIVRKREGHRLDEWKRQVAESGIAELQRFAKGLKRDKEAVEAGLTLVYSNGVVEGKVNKLKLMKRMGYGRASFPFLRQRILHAV
ncbi:transposase [Ktedonosporobacter rubrisoli]|uniref:Transposase n=1 Tax=Ktedonosporobacter rubrisoli TaxID=2509675 RepID=A0A4P6JU98_KTERU|nr:transposase [Ktedonosporobacter rubrisoli]QBD78903.1 transposase [Ktedonosporobacter rubrisoli]